MNETIRNTFVTRNNDTLLQLFRYSFVGGLAFLVDFGLLVILTELAGIHYLLSATMSFLASLIVNYWLSKVWIFTHSTVKSKTVEFLIFTVIGINGLLINDLLLWLFTNRIGLWYLLSKAIVAVITYFWNFFARKIILFK